MQHSALLDSFSRAGSARKESSMKNALSIIARAFSPVLIFILAALLSVPNARADLSLNLDLYESLDPNSGQTNWYTWAGLNTTNTIVTYYQLYSTHSNILGSVNGGTTSTIYFSDLTSMLNEITNGNWTLILNVGDPSQQTYTFHVTANGISSNTFPAFQITNPAFHGSVSNATVNFAWSGPTNWDNIYVNLHDNSGAFYQVSTLPGNATTWNGNAPLDSSYFDYTFGLDFATDGSAYFAFSTPLTSGSVPLTGWSAIPTLHLDENRDFFFNWTLAFSGHELIAHYPFDDSSYLGQDTSGNGNDLNGASWWGTPQQFTTNAVAGGGSVQFFGFSSLTVSGQSLGSWDAALGGSFTISAWVKTTDSVGNPTDDAINGSTLLWAYNNNISDTIPLALTGGKEAFTTGDHLGNITTLHSTTSVNDGQYHLITITRDQTTGLKSVYVDGDLEATEIGTTDPLNGNTSYLSLGGSFQSAFIGLADDVQIYAGVLSATEVASLYTNPGTTISNKKGAGTGGLVVHYDFDEGTVLAPDVSGNGNDMVYAGDFGGSGPSISSGSAAGAGSVSFDGGSYLTASSNLLSTLAGEFSVSLWLKTSQSYGHPGDLAWEGAGVICEDSPNAGARDLIPIALTGGQVAFNIGDGVDDDTLNSSATVNDGAWHHVVVTRDLTTGNRQIFIDGNLDSSEISSTVLLNSPVLLTMGAKADASNPDPTSPGYTGSNGYQGLVDDIQIYDRVLAPSEVTYLYNHPGSTVAGVNFASALGTTTLQWSTSGDADWFVENTNTYNGSPFAAQSGAISNYQTSTLTATVTGPGTLNFYWSSVDNDPDQNMDYEFAIDDPNTNDIADLYGANGWQSIEDTLGINGPVAIPPGQHTLIWTVYANNDADPYEAGFLDQVVFMPLDTSPVSANITLNIYRAQDPTFGEVYLAFPSFNSVTPAATGTTTNAIQSPNNDFNGQVEQGSGGSGSLYMYSLGSVLNECTNGLWSLYINYGLQNQRQFQFSVAINGLGSNQVPAVKIITPTNGATGFLSTAAIQWLGPTNYTSLNVSKQNIDGSGYVGTALPVTATSWTPGLVPGTNRCDINYASNNYPNVSFTVPVDSVDSQTVSVWAAQVNLNSTATSIFVVTAGPSSVQLINMGTTSTNFQFSFQSQTGFTNTIQYRTNLVVGAWRTYTNVVGDGSVKTNMVPLSLFAPSEQGFIRVSTQ